MNFDKYKAEPELHAPDRVQFCPYCTPERRKIMEDREKYNGFKKVEEEVKRLVVTPAGQAAAGVLHCPSCGHRHERPSYCGWVVHDSPNARDRTHCTCSDIRRDGSAALRDDLRKAETKSRISFKDVYGHSVVKPQYGTVVHEAGTIAKKATDAAQSLSELLAFLRPRTYDELVHMPSCLCQACVNKRNR